MLRGEPGLGGPASPQQTQAHPQRAAVGKAAGWDPGLRGDTCGVPAGQTLCWESPLGVLEQKLSGFCFLCERLTHIESRGMEPMHTSQTACLGQ